jgi:hypothetical protein
VKAEIEAGKKQARFYPLATLPIPQAWETGEKLILGSHSSQPSQPAVKEKTRTQQPLEGFSTVSPPPTTTILFIF